MVESQDNDIARAEEKATRENKAFERLYDFIKEDLIEHKILTDKLLMICKDFEDVDFTEDLKQLLKEHI